MFDADAYLETLQPPTIKIGGKEYVGRLLSIEEWLPFEPRLNKIAKQEADVDEIRDTIRDYCNLVFQPTWKDLFNFRRKTVAEQIVALPPRALLKAAADFFESQARALNGPSGETATEG
jgi:hypothetical protein